MRLDWNFPSTSTGTSTERSLPPQERVEHQVRPEGRFLFAASIPNKTPQREQAGGYVRRAQHHPAEERRTQTRSHPGLQTQPAMTWNRDGQIVIGRSDPVEYSTQ